MKALIVTAHPDLKSFTMALSTISESALLSHGFEVNRSDLHQMKFSAGAGPDDFQGDFDESIDLQDRQLAAVRENGFVTDLAVEIEKVREADLIVFHFPLWWFSVPGLLKGWIDRTFAYGFAYGRHGNLKGRKAIVVTSTGGPESSYANSDRETVEGWLKHFLVGTLEFCGIEVYPIFVAYGPERMTEEGRQIALESLRSHINLCLTKFETLNTTSSEAF